MEKITSAKNSVIQGLRSLREAKSRKAAGLFLVEGEVMLREAIACGLKPDTIAADTEREALAAEFAPRAQKTILVTRELLESICDTKTPQGICASFSMPEQMGEDSLPERIVALDGVQDPGNVGTIWRTADAAGFSALLLGTGSADPLSPKVQRSAMGSGFRVPFLQTAELSEMLYRLKQKGYKIIVSDLKGDDFYARTDCGDKFVLVIGNEAKGISDAVRACGNVRVKLPMRGGAESLNAAVAAGIMMYELMRSCC